MNLDGGMYRFVVLGCVPSYTRLLYFRMEGVQASDGMAHV
jgi:hypothetical protein